MLPVFCDVFNTFCQSILFTWVVHNITDKNKQITRLQSIFLTLIIFADGMLFTYSGIHLPFANFIMILIALLFTILFYRRTILEAFAGFGLAYSLIAIEAYFLVNLYQIFFSKLALGISLEVQMLLFIYMPVWLNYIVFYKFRKYIFDSIIYIKNLKYSLPFIIFMDLAIIILDTFRLDWTNEGMGITFKFFIYLLTFLAFIAASVFFAKVSDKAREVEILNKALYEKINELKKLKHDYGSEISSMYGLYQLQRYDRIGEILKGIVERYQTTAATISTSLNISPVIASVLHSATQNGINVIASDDADYDKLPLTDNELLKLTANIVNNSIEVLRNVENPTIKFRSYNSYYGITISIMNNGPEIPEKIKEKIFETGFSTRDNTKGDRGYGLSIVKDIVNKYNGSVSIESNSKTTNFKIEFPNR